MSWSKETPTNQHSPVCCSLAAGLQTMCSSAHPASSVMKLETGTSSHQHVKVMKKWPKLYIANISFAIRCKKKILTFEIKSFTEISCPKPPPGNFEVQGAKTVYNKNEILIYSCNEGYKKVDERPSLCKKVGHSSQWTPQGQM